MLQKCLLYEEIRFPLTQTANPEISLQPADIPFDSLLPPAFIQSKFKIIHALYSMIAKIFIALKSIQLRGCHGKQSPPCHVGGS